jgi:hypothetical protein
MDGKQSDDTNKPCVYKRKNESIDRYLIDTVLSLMNSSLLRSTRFFIISNEVGGQLKQALGRRIPLFLSSTIHPPNPTF